VSGWRGLLRSSANNDLQSAQGSVLKTFPGEIANPQPTPQNAMSCTTCAVFGSPRVLVSSVTAEVASSSLVVPAILFKHLQP
jgi:hypothetical protein